MKEDQPVKQLDNQKVISGNSETYKRGENPRSLANLKPWEKGESGNPSGRPWKHEGLRLAVREYSDQMSKWEKHLTNRETVIERIWWEAGCGSIQHIRILAELGCLNKSE